MTTTGTVEIAPEAYTLDTKTHGKYEPCPGATCANDWHRFSHFLDTHYRTCGSETHLGSGWFENPIHRFWDAFERRCKPSTVKGAKLTPKARGPKGSPILDPAGRLAAWYRAEKFGAGLDWLAANGFTITATKAAEQFGHKIVPVTDRVEYIIPDVVQ